MDDQNVSDELSAAKQRIAQLEKELRLQKEKFEGIVSHLPEPTVIFNNSGAMEIINQAARVLLERIKLQPGDIGDIRAHVDFFDAQDRPLPIWEVPPVRVMKGETLVNYRVKARFGTSYNYIDFNGIPIRDEDGAVAYAVMSFRDTTELVNSEEHYSNLVESMQSGVVHHDADGTIIKMNRAAQYILGWDSSALVGNKSPEPVRPPYRADGTIFPFEEHPAIVALQTGLPNQDTIMGGYNPVLKEYRWININAIPLFRLGETKPYQAFTVFDDITEQKKIEDALVKSEALLRAVLDSSSDVTYCYNLQTNLYEYVSPACLKVFGFTPEEMAAMDLDTIHSMTHPDDKHIFGVQLEGQLRDKGSAEIQYRQRTKDGEYRWVNNRLSVVRDKAGKPLYRNGNIRDITMRKKMEDALREREMHLRLAAQGGELGTYAFDMVNDKMFISDELKVLWGIKPGDPVLLGDDLFFEGLHPDDKQEFIDRIKASNDPSSGGAFEMDYRIIREDGRIKWLHSRGLTTFIGEGAKCRPAYSAGVVVDMTQRVDFENSIREKSEQLRNIIESTDDFIWSVDRNFKLVLFNSSFARYIQNRYKRELKKGMHMKEMLSPQSGALWEELYTRTVKDGIFQVEMRMDRGSRVVSYSFNPVYIDAQLVEITVFGRDVTERLNSEREIIRLNASLEKRVSERTEALQKSVTDLQNLSRIISHDLKEPIKEIETYAARMDKNTDVQPYASKIRKTCSNMTHMIEALSKYAMASDHKIHKETVNVKRMVTAVFSDLKPSMTNSAVLQFDSGLPPVCADKVLIRQAIYNLLSNAVKFSSKREAAQITVGCAEENGHYVFHIRDNGTGFDMKYAHKLFNIFERLHTKDEFEGSGMGLAAVRNIIQGHGGKVWIESEEDVGTVVYFSLPVNTETN